MQYLRKDTAIKILLGPFVDSIDGVTPKTNLQIQAGDIFLHKHNATHITSSNATAAHEAHGYYIATISASDVDTPGTLSICCTKTGALPVWNSYIVLSSDMYDSIVPGTQPIITDSLENDINTYTAPSSVGRVIRELNATALATNLHLTDNNFVYVESPVVIQNGLRLYKGTTFESFSLSVPALSTPWENIFFTVKARRADTNANSILMISYEDGLLRLNAAVAEHPAWAMLNEQDSTISIWISDDATSLISQHYLKWCYWDIKITYPNGESHVPYEGRIQLTQTITG